ncbi:MAG: glycosyltransferase [Verrucomicrobiae bacterium]|nr:glycosyltransferase [Verrucomicrobiae bacterium]
MNPLPRVVLAAHARPREGGLGLNFAHMLAGLEGAFEVETFSPTSMPGVSDHTVAIPAWIGAAFRWPGVRRLRALHANLIETAFDRHVARALPPCAVFQGLTGHCEHSLARAKALGAGTLLDVVTVHDDEGNLRVAREMAAFGVRFRPDRTQGARRRREYAAADRIRVMSHHARETFLQRGFDPERVVVVSPPIETEQFPAATFRHDRFRVTFIGRLEVGKAFHHVVEAFRAARLPDSELVLWGGSGSREVARYLREHVTPHPAIHVRPVPIRDAGLDEVFGKSHVIVHPSVADGFGYVVAEAMASGVPVIVSTTTGGRDWVIDGHNGFIVPVGDRDALRERLAWCHRHSARLPELGRAARATAVSRSLARFREDYLPLIRSLIRPA